MSWRKITFIIVVLAILLGGSAALSLLFVSLKPEPPRKPEIELVRYVNAKTVLYSQLKSPVSREGRVVSGSEVMLVAEASGRIEKGDVTLKKGASFKKGQLLATIYKDEVELALKARKSRFLTTFTTMLPDLKVDFQNEYSSFIQFLNSIDMDKKLPELPEYHNDKLKIFLASRNIISEYYGIQQDEKKLSRHELYAPFDGAFSQVNFEVGAYANTGGQIAKMIKTGHLEIEVPVEVGQSEWIKIGDKVNVFSAKRNIVRKGTVVRKADFVDMDTQMRSIFVDLKNLGGSELLSGEYNLVEFPGQTIENAMEIDRSAVFNSNEVFTVVDGKLKKRQIDILKWNEKTLIFTGLEEGLKVVSESLINAKENSPVGIVGEEQPARQQGSGSGKAN